MNGLTVEQEAALAYLYLHQEDPFDQPVCKKHAHGTMMLQERGLVKAEADFDGNVHFRSLTSSGASHYDTARAQRRALKAFDDDADALVLELAAEDKTLKKAGDKQFVTVDDSRIGDYWTLKRHGLIDGLPADNTLMAVTVTDDGRSYAEGWFLNQMSTENGTSIINNTFNPTINIDAASHAESASNSSVNVKNSPLIIASNAIIDIDSIDSSLREQALKAAKDLDAVSRTSDRVAFSDKLEKLASLAKNSAALAEALLPLAKFALGNFLS